MKNTTRAVHQISDTFTLHLIEMALSNVHEQLSAGDPFKASPSDLIRLIDAHQTMQQSRRPSEVLVRWIDQVRYEPNE